MVVIPSFLRFLFRFFYSIFLDVNLCMCICTCIYAICAHACMHACALCACVCACVCFVLCIQDILLYSTWKHSFNFSIASLPFSSWFGFVVHVCLHEFLCACVHACMHACGSCSLLKHSLILYSDIFKVVYDA